MKLEFRIPQAALELHRFAATKEARNTEIMSLRIEKTPRSLTAVATDGHRLCSVTWDYPKKLSAANIKSLPININAKIVGDFLSKLRKEKRKNKKDLQFFLTIKGNDELTLLTNKGDAAEVGQYKKDPGYPDWHHIIPPRLNGTNQVSKVFGVNARYVGEFATYLSSVGIKEPTVKVHYEDPTDNGPMLLIPATSHPLREIKNIECILMPVRVR